MENIYGLIQRLEEYDSRESNQGDEDFGQVLKKFTKKFHESMDDDFNTPKTLAAIHEFRGGINKLLSKGLSDQMRKTIVDSLRKYGKPLGLFQLTIPQWNAIVLRPSPVIIEMVALPVKVVDGSSNEEERIEEQIQLRNEARGKKDFATSDTIRKELAAQGIILEDRPDGTTRWKR